MSIRYQTIHCASCCKSMEKPRYSAEFLGGSEQKDGPTCKGNRSFTERTVFKAVKIEKTIECTWAE